MTSRTAEGDGVDRKQAARKLELQQQLDEKVAQKDYAGAAALQDDIKSLDQADDMLRQKASRKQELSQQIAEKVARKDYAGAAVLQERLKEDAMPPRSQGDDDSAHALLVRRIQVLEQHIHVGQSFGWWSKTWLL